MMTDNMGDDVDGETMCRKAILCVDDQQGILDFLMLALGDEDHEVITAANLEEGLAILNSPVHLDLMLTDVKMERSFDGITLATEANRVRPTMPVILITGFAETLDPKKHRWPVLSKPFKTRPLIDAVHRAMATA
jgi:DNA-binding NtrC family response regulator